jgi:hypothetical protein
MGSTSAARRAGRKHVDTARNSERNRTMYHLDEVPAFRKQSQTFENITTYSGSENGFLYPFLYREPGRLAVVGVMQRNKESKRDFSLRGLRLRAPAGSE